jgi:hypothetical protein
MRYGARNMGLDIVHPQKGGLVKLVNITPNYNTDINKQ